jgi:hypothetical protein
LVHPVAVGRQSLRADGIWPEPGGVHQAGGRPHHLPGVCHRVQGARRGQPAPERRVMEDRQRDGRLSGSVAGNVRLRRSAIHSRGCGGHAEERGVRIALRSEMRGVRTVFQPSKTEAGKVPLPLAVRSIFGSPDPYLGYTRHSECEPTEGVWAPGR